MLTQPYAIQVFACTQCPYEHVLTKYEHLGFEQCSDFLCVDGFNGMGFVFYRISSNSTNYLANPASPVSATFCSTLRVNATGSMGMR